MKKVILMIFFLSASIISYSEKIDTYSFEIKGVIPPTLSLSTDLSDIETVDLVNATSAYLGKIVVFTNSKGLWKIVVRSANGGKLLGKTIGNSDSYPYTLEFGEIEPRTLSSDLMLTYNTLVPKSNVEYPVSIHFKKLEDLDDPVISDTYTDIVTIIVTIS